MSVDELMQGDFLENMGEEDDAEELDSEDDGLSNEVYVLLQVKDSLNMEVRFVVKQIGFLVGKQLLIQF